MLPLQVELELYMWIDITRNLLIAIPGTLVLIYIGIKTNEDEMWIGKKFAHVISAFFAFWAVTNMLAPFLIMTYLHPDLMFELGERILHDFGIVAIIVTIGIAILQFMHYKGYLRKSN